MFKKVILTSAILAVSPLSHALDLGTYKDTNFQIGGYVKTEGVFNMPDDGSDSFDATARQTRINFAATRNVEGHEVKGFIETDFYGNYPKNELRLRHAYLKVDNFLMGQYWNGQLLGSTASDLIDFLNPNRGNIMGSPASVVRPTLLHYTQGKFRLSIQDPVYTDADMPDLVFNYRTGFSNGNSLSFVASVREAENEFNDDSEVLAGIAASGKIMLGKNDIRLNAHYGEGWAAHTQVGNDFENGDAISQYGVTAAYRHVFDDKNRSSIQYTYAEVDDIAKTDYQSVHVNFIHNITKNMEVGIEWRQYDMSPDASRGFQDKSQVEVMAMYKF